MERANAFDFIGPKTLVGPELKVGDKAPAFVVLGAAYGTYIKEVRLESRAVFVVDGAGVIRHAEYVPTAGQHPDYDAALAVLAKLV
jgi:peroxiredoxin